MHVLVVGSSVIDLFLSIERHAEIIAGKVQFNLGDKIPSSIKEMGLGGNGANVSVGLTRLEIPTSFYTYLGGDILSAQIEEGLSSEGIELIIEREKDYTSSFSIILDFNDDRIIFSHHQKREHNFSLKSSDYYDYIYLTSIGDYWEKAYREVYNFSEKNKIPIAFSPGMHQLESMNDTVFNIIKNSQIFFSNKQEAEIVLGKGKDRQTPSELLLGIKKLGPSVVSITDGENGSYALDKDNRIFSTKALHVEAAEKTGAGDAYAAAFFAAYLLGHDVKTAMVWGSFNANSVMQKVGAQRGLLTKKGLDKILFSTNNSKVQKL